VAKRDVQQPDATERHREHPHARRTLEVQPAEG
jgi:hypothetical protein